MSDKCSTKGVLRCDINKATPTTGVLLSYCCRELCLLVHLKGGSDKKQSSHSHHQLQFPSEVSLAYITSVTKVLIVLLLEHLWMAAICNGSISVFVLIILDHSNHLPLFCAYFWDALYTKDPYTCKETANSPQHAQHPWQQYGRCP
jgi:hypothetical protein